MAYLENYDYDIFISYAHVDDQPLSAGDEGWVTKFTNLVKWRLDQKLGRRDAYALWMDHEIRTGRPITPYILEKLQRSAILVAVLSPGYAQSEWCRRELHEFANFIAAGERRSIFILERDPNYEGANLPPAVADLKRATFWAQDRKTGNARTMGDPRPTDEYYLAVDDIVQDIVAELKEMKGAQPRLATTAPSGSKGTVFLAEVTDDLDEQRNGVKRYLEQAGIAVAPRHLPFDPDAFRHTVREGLADADLFVQLLSDIPGKRPPDLPEGRVKCQLELARSLGKPVLQWRNATLDLASVRDDVQRELLDSQTVLAEGIEDFKREICRFLEDRRTAPPGPPPTDADVFIDRDAPDKLLADQLAAILRRYEIGTMVPSEDKDPKKFRRDRKFKLDECNVLILIYGATTRSWIDEHIKEVLKTVTRRKPLRGFALLEAPPDSKDTPTIWPRHMKQIDCREGIQEAQVKRFLESLNGGAA